MAQHPFLKSIRPVNLLSFGPNTEEIELRPLNILIGPNGSGKSNFVEIVGLLKELPDKDPWSTIVRTGGVDEWLWKGGRRDDSTAASPSIMVTFDPPEPGGPPNYYEIRLVKHAPTYSLHVFSETLGQIDPETNQRKPFFVHRTHDSPDSATVRSSVSHFSISKAKALDVRLPILSQLVDVFNYPELYYFEQKISRFALYRDWVFGVDAEPRDPQSAGERTIFLEEDHRNLAHMLNALRTGDNFGLRDRFRDLLSRFYDGAEDVEIELLGGRISLRLREESGVSTPASRLSDGTLRWLSLLVILLNPTPPPLTCIEEPELGLHPDAIHTLADLLREASTRTQLIVTTHSDALVDAFSDDPEAVCVCEKVEGSTVIRRLDKERLTVWLKDYSLGHLWMSGEIGGNRW